MSFTSPKQSKRKIFSIVLLFLIISLFIPTPYYIFQPGSVEELKSKVTVKGGEKDSRGNLYLTTVLSLRASNIYYLAYGLLAPHSDIQKVEDVRGDLSDEEYNRLLEHMMTTSQQQALVAGLRAAGEQVNVQPTGLFVRGILASSDAKGKLQVGDIITKIDGNNVQEAEKFLEYLADKKAGDQVELSFTREGKDKKANIKLIPMENAKNAAGVGIVPEDQYNVQTSRTVKIHAEDIGGPSAGLMFSLEIYDQATPGDITKGYEIAGTGTIDMDGNVGQIGGIREKITAVSRENIDIFFCPKDVFPGDTNEQDVKDEVKKEGYDVKVVPVKTLQEAIDYLEKLPAKNEEE